MGSPGPTAPAGVAAGVPVGATGDGACEPDGADDAPAWDAAGAVAPQAASGIETSPASSEAAMRL
jgi:hypothetical protein